MQVVAFTNPDSQAFTCPRVRPQMILRHDE